MRLSGVNSVIFSESGGNIGIGFAIPINIAEQLLPQLRQGKVSRSWLGVMIEDITPELKAKLDLETEEGALVSDVVPGGPAEKAGLIPGDIIVEIDKMPVGNLETFNQLLAGVKEGDTILFLVDRGGTTVFVTLTVKK